MARSDSLKQKAKQTKDVFFGNNNVNYYNSQTDIKQAVNTVNYRYLNQKLSLEQSLDFNTFTIYNELSDFYQTKIKTSILKTIVERIADKVIDNRTEIYLNETLYDTNIKINNTHQVIEVDKTKINNFVKEGIVYDRINFKVDITEDKLKLTPLNVFEFTIEDNHFKYVYAKGDKKYVEERYTYQGSLIITISEIFNGDIDNKEVISEESYPFDSLLVYTHRLDADIMTEGLKELSLVYSNLMTYVNRDAVLSGKKVFASKEYFKNGEINLNADQYELRDSPDTTNGLIDGKDPLFQVNGEILDAYNAKIELEQIKREMGYIIGVDSTTLGIDSSAQLATTVKREFKQTAEKINTIKEVFESTLNIIFQKVSEDLGLNKIINIKLFSYVTQDATETAERASVLFGAGALDYFDLARELYPEKDEDEQNIYALKRIIKAGEIMTEDETELALSYGLITEPIVIEDNSQTETEDNTEETELEE